MGYAILVLLGLIPLLWAMSISPLLKKVSLLEYRLKQMDVRLEQIAKQVGVTEPRPGAPADNELRMLVAGGKEPEAIKRVMTGMGLSLRDAKAYVEAL